jgi:beta-aspartyl-dipeptidase (metallo-type)
MFVLVRGGELYGPEPLGERSILIAAGRIVRIGDVEPARLEALGVEFEVIDATGCVVTPGFVDPHEHLLGAGGEQGFGSRQPEISRDEIALAGITTVVGVLGTDSFARHLPDLLAKARQLRELGLSVFIYTGGFTIPPQTITNGVIEDIVMIDQVIGVGEIAIADVRSIEPSVDELARLVSQSALGGLLSNKAGVTHFHVGAGRGGLGLLEALLERFDIDAAHLYPTHVERSPALLDAAIGLAHRGSFVDLDTVEPGVGRWIRYYREHDGDPDQLTVSSDAHTPGGTPGKLHQAFVSGVRDDRLPLADCLAHFTRNPARALKLSDKGQLREGAAGDVLVMRRDSLEVVHLLSRGESLVRDGEVVG